MDTQNMVREGVIFTNTQTHEFDAEPAKNTTPTTPNISVGEQQGQKHASKSAALIATKRTRTNKKRSTTAKRVRPKEATGAADWGQQAIDEANHPPYFVERGQTYKTLYERGIPTGSKRIAHFSVPEMQPIISSDGATESTTH